MPLACQMLRGAEYPPGRCSWDEGLVFISSRNGTSVLGQIRRFGGGSACAAAGGPGQSAFPTRCGRTSRDNPRVRHQAPAAPADKPWVKVGARCQAHSGGSEHAASCAPGKG